MKEISPAFEGGVWNVKTLMQRCYLALRRHSERSEESKSYAKRVAFLLAEVLITLSLLDIVAVIAVPGITSRIQDRIQISRLKQAYAILSNAYDQMVAIYGHPLNWEGWKDMTEENRGILFARRMNFCL